MSHSITAISGILIGCFAVFEASGALPGDIAAAAGTPLVAAHSMTRALYSRYNGKIFKVQRTSDSALLDIGVTGPGGYADMEALNRFCSGATCHVCRLYDQSGNGNDLRQAVVANQPDLGYWSISNGTLVPMAVSTHRQWLRNRDSTSNIPTGAASQTEIMVVHGLYYNNSCCYDYGNMGKVVKDLGNGTMNALYFGSKNWGGAAPGPGPWGQVDMENGLYAGGNKGIGSDPDNLTTLQNLVTVLSKDDGTTSWVLKVGDGSTGPLHTYWNGGFPKGYSPLRQQGGLSLGEGGDGSAGGIGAFFEGVVIAAMTQDATDSSIQANITSVYGTTRSSAFTPAGDPALEAWWDGNDTSSMTFGSGVDVQRWTDKSPHHYAAAQGTAAHRPVYCPQLLNGKGGLRFTRADTSLLTSAGAEGVFTHGFSIYYVLQPTTQPVGDISVFSQATAAGGEPGVGFSNTRVDGSLAIAEFGVDKAAAAFKYASRVPYIVGFVSAAGAPVAGGTFTATPYVNGTAGSPLSRTLAHAYTPTGLHIGSDRFNDAFDGYLYELVVSSDTTAATRRKYEAYFAAKYGMAGFLPPGHTPTSLSPSSRSGQHPMTAFSRYGRLYLTAAGEEATVSVRTLLGQAVYAHRFTGLGIGTRVEIDLPRSMSGTGSTLLIVDVESGGKTSRIVVPAVGQ